MAEVRGIVVVGGGLAGGKTVEALRDNGYQGPVTLLAAEPHLPYERPPLSKGFLAGDDERDSVFVHDEQWYADHQVTLRLGESVTAVDTAAHEVETSSGERLAYDRLVLATGSQPRLLDLPDLDDAHRERVLYLRTLDDSERLKGWLREGVRLAVVGGGWIGLEVASAARGAGVEVTVVEMDSVPLQRVLGSTVAEAFAQAHRAHGVDLRTGVSVEGVTASGQGLRVALSDGSQVEADVVLVGIGIVPDTALAEAAGLAVDNGVLTDAQLRTSDPDVFAVGDVANADYPAVGRRLRVEHWASALNQPAVVARAIVGGDDTYDLLPYFFTDQYDLGMEYHGIADPQRDRVVVRGQLDGAFVAAWVGDDGKVRAAMHVNCWDDADAVKALVGQPLDEVRFTDTEAPLS
ncbi:NAD(P)/FAD-dependent oxidoreductase [Angustibacter sp. Root456]|uniref:NAD(P)/FAD-dependent oxidoreductase n=1 Tax=Angustibacter sp. Root456 TaxID=1736539 RepID=UPI0006FC5023|nr:FAD-dependent oxidoreductase [Angustibacter sp. Root456]KQX69388.1 pyridine nucleotide-disulfide oxidoreductase [Angustibacter sp. Root456]